MGVEIWRKIRVDASAVPEAARVNGARFTQGYLSHEPVVRVRLAEYADRAPEAWITIKGRGTLTRAEFEYAIPAEDARAMVPLCVAVLAKTRYHVAVGDHTWDLDEYHGALDGLWLAEVELTREDEPFERPAWVTDEVTDDARYTNVALALKAFGRGPA